MILGKPPGYATISIDMLIVCSSDFTIWSDKPADRDFQEKWQVL